MKIYHSILAFKNQKISNPVITFGSFDGVHRGHAYIFEKMIEYAHSIDGETVVTTFHPHPRKIIYPEDRSMKLLTPIDEKIERMRSLGIDHLVIIPFSIEFSQMSPDEYIESFIIRHYAPHTIMIGYDHRFGLNRIGDINTLRAYQERGDFLVTEIPQKRIESMKISSTRIRRALENQNVIQANKLLGYSYSITGTVIHGEKIGSEIGFKTANISPCDLEKLIPGNGIYAVNVHIENENHNAMLYIGTRSTIPTGGKLSIEVHIFNFEKDIYHEEIVVEFVDFIRKDATFESLEKLSENIKADREKALEIFDDEKAGIQT